MSPTRDCSLRSMLLPTVSPADQSSELGPRSLDPAALFGARLPSLFEARRRLPTSAIHITTCGQPNPSSCDPRRDDGLDRLPFLEPVTPLPCGSGDERRAALRSFVSAPVPVSSHLRGFARPRYQLERPTIPDCSVMHSEDQRARVEGPSEGRVPWRLRRSLVPASGAYALWRMPTNVPLLGDLLDIRCHRRACLQRRIPPPARTDRPRPSFRQCPAKSTAFQKTRMPFTVTTREGFVVCAKGLLPPAFAPALPLTPPTRFPQRGPCSCWALRVSRCGHPLGP
jgi:hypothetical protein